jgi:cation transport ATPase
MRPEHPVATALRRAAGDRLPRRCDHEPGQGIEALVAVAVTGWPSGLRLGLSAGIAGCCADWLVATRSWCLGMAGCLALFRIGDELRAEALA